MAKYSTLPETLDKFTKSDLQELIVATEEVFAGDLFGGESVNRSLKESYTTPDQKYHWTKNEDLFNYVTTLTDTDDIKSANAVLYETVTKAPEYSSPTTTQIPEYKTTNTTALRADEIKSFDEAAQARVKAKAAADEKGIRQTKAFLDQQKQRVDRLKEIAQKVEKKVIYYKVNPPPEEKLPEKQETAVKTFKEEAKVDSPKLYEDISEKIEKVVLPTKPDDVPVELVETVSKRAALDTVQILNDEPLIARAVVINRIATNPAVLEKIVPDVETRTEIKDIADLLAQEDVEQYKLTREYVRASFGEPLAQRIYGPEKITQITVEFSETPSPGFEEFEIDQIPNRQLESVKNQSAFVENLKGFGQDEIKSAVLSRVNTRITSEVAKLPVNSFAARTYNNKLVQASLSYFGLGTPVNWAGTSMFGRLAMSTGFGPTLGWAGEFTGINFGVTRVATVAATEAISTGGVVAATEATAVATAELGAAGAATAATTIGTTAVTTTVATGTAAVTATATGGTAAAGAATGLLGGPLAWLTVPLGALAGAIFGKAITKIGPWIKKHQDTFLAAGSAVLVGGAVLGSPLLMALGAPFAAMTLLRGITGAGFGGVGAVFVGAIAWLGGAAFITIGLPLIIALVVFPVIVAIILFIINSGAYVVPPSIATQTSDNPYIDVVKTASPAGPFENGDSALGKITYTITVKAKKGSLANINFRHTCKVVVKGGQSDCPAPEPEAPFTVSPSAPFVYTYDADYSGSNYIDSLVINSFEVTADVPEKQDITTSGSSTITIGKPPSDCLKVDGAWPATQKANIESAIGNLVAGHSNYVAKVCAVFPQGLPLRYSASGNASYWGYNRGDHIDFYALGVKSPNDALYTLAHELGHSLENGVKGIMPAYLSFPGIKTETPTCFYSYGTDVYEKLSEAIAFYVMPIRQCSLTGKSSSIQNFPVHLQFLKRYVFN
ncbi:MAG: hypothetical protein ACHQUA_01460 [Microgenomates group bacterium]